MHRPPPARRRWFDGLAGVVVLLVGLPTGCNSTPLRQTDFSGRTPIVRVLLLSNRTTVTLTADAPPVVKQLGDPASRHVATVPGMPVTVSLTARGWKFGDATLPGRAELTLQPAVEGSVRIDGKAYRGRFRFVPKPIAGSLAFDLVNDVDVENYLRGVLTRELPPDFAPAAYSAQAVVARTYALYTVKATGSSARYDLFADERSQVYGGLGAESPKAIAAVEQTAGEVVAYGRPGEERIFKAYFSSCCGGVGQSAADAFGDVPIPPLAARNVGNLCAASPSFSWPTLTVGKAELARRLRKWGTSRNRPEANVATLQRVDVAAANVFGRPVRFTVLDTAGHRFTLTGEELRTAVNTDAPPKGRLLSSLFRLADSPESVAFVDGHGRGHGVGMCQWCAEAQAVQGMGYADIVRFAYPSAVILRAY